MTRIFLSLIVFVPCLFRLAQTDIKRKELENPIIFAMLLCAPLYKTSVISRLIGGLFPIILIPFMGFGDILMFCVVGIVFGIKDLLFIICISSIISGVVCAFMQIIKKLRLKSKIAYAPYICLAIIINTLKYFFISDA